MLTEEGTRAGVTSVKERFNGSSARDKETPLLQCGISEAERGELIGTRTLLGPGTGPAASPPVPKREPTNALNTNRLVTRER